MPEMETGSTEGAVKGSGRRGPVGRRELGKVDCSTGSLGGKMEPSGPEPPNPEGSGCRASGLNLNVASLGRNLSRSVTAGTVGTLSVTGRGLGWNLLACAMAGWLPGTNWNCCCGLASVAWGNLEVLKSCWASRLPRKVSGKS